jgi:Rrf2 family protein
VATPTNSQFSVAVHLLSLLAGAAPGQVLDSVSLAAGPATNPAHVRRILGRLRTAGLVRSQQGAHGGWTLAHAPADIDLAQIWLAVNGEDPLLAVHNLDSTCPLGTRLEDTLRRLDRRALALLLEELGALSIADVVAGLSIENLPA